MADFSDAEDRQLVQVALRFELAGKPISWIYVAKRMPKWTKNREKLKYRLKALKVRFGAKLSEFPSRFLAPATLKKASRHSPKTTTIRFPARQKSEASLPTRQSPPQPAQLPVGLQKKSAARRHHVDLLQFDDLLASLRARSNILPEEECEDIVRGMFHGVSRADVRQRAGRAELNMGELSVRGVTELIRACSLRDEDVFLDVGAGIGNVVVQVALQTRVKQSLGIELRSDAVALSQSALTEQRMKNSQLGRAILFLGDVRDAPLVWRHEEIASSTVLYSFNEVFEADSILELESLCCRLPALRLIVVSTNFCPRHAQRNRCMNVFCSQWIHQGKIFVDVTFKSKPAQLNVYHRIPVVSVVGTKSSELDLIRIVEEL
jgi:hypothetical protein